MSANQPEAAIGNRHIPRIPYWLDRKYKLQSEPRAPEPSQQTADPAVTVNSDSRGPGNCNQEPPITIMENQLNQSETQNTVATNGDTNQSVQPHLSEDHPIDLSMPSLSPVPDKRLPARLGQDYKQQPIDPDLITISDDNVPNFDQLTPSSTPQQRKRKGVVKKQNNKQSRCLKITQYIPTKQQPQYSKFKFHELTSYLPASKPVPLTQDHLQERDNSSTNCDRLHRMAIASIATGSQNLINTPHQHQPSFPCKPPTANTPIPNIHHQSQYSGTQEQRTPEMNRPYLYHQNTLSGGHVLGQNHPNQMHQANDFLPHCQNRSVPVHGNYMIDQMRYEALRKNDIGTHDSRNAAANMQSYIPYQFPNIENPESNQNPPILHNQNQCTASFESDLPLESNNHSKILKPQATSERRFPAIPEPLYQPHSNGEGKFSAEKLAKHKIHQGTDALNYKLAKQSESATRNLVAQTARFEDQHLPNSYYTGRPIHEISRSIDMTPTRIVGGQNSVVNIQRAVPYIPELPRQLMGYFEDPQNKQKPPIYPEQGPVNIESGLLLEHKNSSGIPQELTTEKLTPAASDILNQTNLNLRSYGLQDPRIRAKLNRSAESNRNIAMQIENSEAQITSSSDQLQEAQSPLVSVRYVQISSSKNLLVDRATQTDFYEHECAAVDNSKNVIDNWCQTDEHFTGEKSALDDYDIALDGSLQDSTSPANIADLIQPWLNKFDTLQKIQELQQRTNKIRNELMRNGSTEKVQDSREVKYPQTCPKFQIQINKAPYENVMKAVNEIRNEAPLTLPFL